MALRAVGRLVSGVKLRRHCGTVRRSPVSVRSAALFITLPPLSYLGYEALRTASCATVVFALDKAEQVVEQADYLYGCGEVEKLYQLLEQYKDSDDAEFLWRLARVSRDLALLPNTAADQKKKLTYEAFHYAKKALEKNEACFAAHKWYAVCLSDIGEYEGVKFKLGNSLIIREHLEALDFFLKAEKVDPNFYSQNLLMLGKTYMMLNDKEKALLWLKKARDYAAITEEDKQAHKEALDLLKKLKG
ncbi:regulator of microtubule dynamics protein 1 isoform 2-T2 [Clarias gariepinus]